MEDEYEEISELPEYSPKSEFSKALRTSEAFTKVIETRGHEMKPGYYNFSMDKNGMVQKIWVADARIVFFGAVEALKNVLAPEIERDKTNTIKDIYKEIEKIKNKYSYEEYILEYKENGMGSLEPFYKKTGEKIMPEIGDEVITVVKNDGGNLSYGPIKGGWDKKVNTYRNLLIDCYDKLFAELSKVIDRLNYFKTSSGW